ncbi:MAG: hypothetical protein M1376_08540 [Planctomycetes bacterium]|nr:hypothetical protein [Planctomycetota bacterium]
MLATASVVGAAAPTRSPDAQRPSGPRAGQPASPHHEFLGGPWEVFVKMGLEGDAIRLPVSVADENKSQSLHTTAPVMGTPIKIKLERYLPDAKSEAAAADDPNGGPVAKLSLRGENLQQDIWLSARERERQSISAPIGSVAIRELPQPPGAALLQELADPKVVGILLIWLSEADSPLVYAAQPGKTVTLADSSPTRSPDAQRPSGPKAGWKLSVLRYVPHYSIDRQTKQVTNLSDKPENPALEIRAEKGGQEYRQWLWSQFAMSPHKQQQVPFRARFLDFHVGAGRYVLAVAPGPQSHLLYLKDGKKCVEQVQTGKQYVFDDKRYSFGVEEVRAKARIETAWKNGSEMLLHPAVMATILRGDTAQPVVLELGQPCHQKTTLGTLVMLYRHVP